MGFVRAGDLLVEGALGVMERALDDAGAAVCGFRLRGRGGWDTEAVPPLLASLGDLKAVAVDAPIELSTLAVRREALPEALKPPCGAPGGEVALVAALLERTRIASTHEVVAEVRMRGEHRGEPEPELARLRGVLHGPLGEDPAVASRIRRRALSIAYLEAQPSVAGRIVPETWWGAAGGARGGGDPMEVLRDLHWVAARAAEARHIAAKGLDGVVAEAPVDVATVAPPDLSTLHAQNQELAISVAELSATTRWLHEEVRVRDARIVSLQGPVPLHGLEEVGGWALARELGRRVRRRLARLVRGGRA